MIPSSPSCRLEDRQAAATKSQPWAAFIRRLRWLTEGSRRPWGQGVNPSAGRGEVIEPDGKGFPTLLFLHELTLFRGLRSAFVDVLNPVDRLAAVII
jgi:hypothetical protein